MPIALFLASQVHVLSGMAAAVSDGTPGVAPGGLRLVADASEECFLAYDGYELPALVAELVPAPGVCGSFAPAFLDPDLKPVQGRLTTA